MTLTERLRTCNDPSGCRRTPRFPDQLRCDEHRERWLPVWRRLAMERPEGLRRDLTGLG